MRNTGVLKKNLWLYGLYVVFMVSVFPVTAHATVADEMKPYCVKPSFVAQSITPNLLMMLDNSSSMYDLQYVDKGRKHCTGISPNKYCFGDSDCNHCSTSTAPCSVNADCPAPQTCVVTGQTCTVTDRNPFYCYDETFSSATTYVGYFDTTKYYNYRTGTSDFAETTFPASCTATAAGNTVYSIPSTLCVEHDAAHNLVSFIASGKYLNWLTASKLDVEKKILTGGKYDGTYLLPESRGCVGEGFVKNANTGDFVNYDGLASLNPNTPLKVTFSVNGPINPRNPSAPSRGGQTYINIYAGGIYNFADCQKAIISIATGTNAAIKTDVDKCLGSSNPPQGLCLQTKAPYVVTPDALLNKTCSLSSDCYRNLTQVPVYSGNTLTSGYPWVCKRDPSMSCTGSGDTASCVVSGACTSLTSKSCMVDNDCVINTPQTLGTCSINSYNPILPRKGNGELKVTVPSSCTTNANCTIVDQWITYTGTCTGYVAARTDNYGPCAIAANPDYGPCTSNYIGGCSLPDGAVQTKTNITFSQAMQACWSYREGTAIGIDEVNTVKNQCDDIYASLKTCSNDHSQTCSVDGDCGGTNTCTTGPFAIGPGNAALICGSQWAGQLYEGSGGIWTLRNTLPASLPTGCTSAMSVTDCMKVIHQNFCNAFNKPIVTDPTDSPSDTSISDNLPSILSGIGVEAQLGKPITPSMRVKLAPSSVPTGLVQEFASKIRMGLLSFNFQGAGTEAKTSATDTDAAHMLPYLKVCSGDTHRSCESQLDCLTATETCDAATSRDGAQILHPAGLGKCYKPCKSDTDCTSGTCDTTTGHCPAASPLVCTNDNNCSSGDACFSDGVGDHSTGLIQKIDDVKGWAWTPFAEAFYDAIGYYAQQSAKVCSISKTICTAATDCPSGETCGFEPVKKCSVGGANCTTSAEKLACAALLGKCVYKSRTDLRLNSDDFDENYNPSLLRCQKNNILLITDGMSTADRNANVSSLATLYAAQTGGQVGWTTKQCSTSGAACTTDSNCPTGQTCDTFPKYGGSMNLDNLAWIAKNRKIGAFVTSGTASTLPPVDPRDSISTYVVFNGANNGEPGERNSETLLKQTAQNGGTTFRKAEGDPALLYTALRRSFEDIGVSAASGTAASILSNSEGSGANILQAVFFPKKIFSLGTEVDWAGEMQNLWYYVDPMIDNSSIREDTDQNGTLNLLSDYSTVFYFDSVNNETRVKRYQDTDGNGVGDVYQGIISADDVKSLWRAGRTLWTRDLSSDSRTIYTNTGETDANGNIFTSFTSDMFPGTGSKTSVLRPHLNVADDAEAENIINYTHGEDLTGYRNRTISVYNQLDGTTTTGVWRLGDIVSSTPRLQSSVRQNTYDMPAPGGYNDLKYKTYINSEEYKDRGMVYVGANDGMLHAFKLGTLTTTGSGFNKATLSGTDLGREQWAFIPKNTLPYLKYYADNNYKGDNHIYSIDGSTVIFDASIGVISGCTAADYWNCLKSPTVVNASNHLVPAQNNWRSLILGGMGLGGATSNATGTSVVKTPVNNLGFSSYFALDVTTPGTPKLLWEFNNTGLGYTTTGPAVVRLGPANKNGRWFAVFGSGPTGPVNVDSKQFFGESTQNLKFFVVDLLTGTLVKTIDTGIANAFAGSMINSPIDADRWNPLSGGNYQDDAIYVGYVKKDDVAGTWTKGGVGRIMIDEIVAPTEPTDANVTNIWHWSPVIDDIGPVTTAITRLQDKKNRVLWLYFGTGRFYYRTQTEVDDNSGIRALYGVKEKCYNTVANPGNVLDKTCTATADALTDQTSSEHTVGSGGWKIELDPSDALNGAERVVTDTVAMTNGVVFFTTFKPTTDPCGYGGNSYLWGVRYDTGGQAASASLKAKALIQLSTGEFKEVALSTAFTDKGNRRMSAPMTGKPPADAPPVFSTSTNKPLKRILHIQEH